jgi:membrane associated rhomboid family serine protease
MSIGEIFIPHPLLNACRVSRSDGLLKAFRFSGKDGLVWGMASRRGLDASVTLLGQRVPFVVALLIGLTLAASLLNAVLNRAGFPLAYFGACIPERVLQGEVWRLLTWTFFEPSPIGLLFTCLMLWWFATELVHSWGARRVLIVYFGFAAASAALTCLVARLVGSGLMGFPYMGSSAVLGALIIAWAVMFPYRQLLVFFVFPLGGKPLIYLTVGLTVLFGLYQGFGSVLPAFFAEGMMLLYMREPTLHRFFLKLRLGALERASRRRSRHLREVKKDGWGEPPRWLH